MELFLMVGAVSLMGLVVTLGLFAVSTHPEHAPDVRIVAAPALAPPQFFVAKVSPNVHAPVPLEVLLSRLERHVRLEQAAAESFLEEPTVRSLHSRTASPLLH